MPGRPRVEKNLDGGEYRVLFFLDFAVLPRRPPHFLDRRRLPGYSDTDTPTWMESESRGLARTDLVSSRPPFFPPLPGDAPRVARV